MTVRVLETIMLIAIISVITMKSSYAELIAMSLENSIEYSIMMTQANRVDWESNPRLVVLSKMTVRVLETLSSVPPG